MPTGLNAKLRAWNMALFGVSVVGALIGWILGKDPSQLVVLFGALTGTATALEAAMVGKRATFKKEAADFNVTVEE